jgi:hypothetical protein
VELRQWGIDAFVHAIGVQIFRRQPAILADVVRRIAVLLAFIVKVNRLFRF